MISPAARAGRMISRTSWARLAFMRSNSVSGVIASLALLCLSVWRISSPMGVPPGSRRVRTWRPRARNRSARIGIWVDLPLPSVPSNVMKRPFMKSDSGARSEFVSPLQGLQTYRGTYSGLQLGLSCCGLSALVASCFSDVAPRRARDSWWTGYSFSSKLLQLRAFGGVFDEPAFGFQFVADGVGAFEIFRFFGGGAGFGEGEDFRGDFGFGFGADAEDGIDFFPGGQSGGGFGGF